MKQRILALLLAAGLCLGLIAAAPALAFSDVSGEELSEAVEVLSGLGIVSGYSDRSYHPDDALTRAQFCKLAVLTEGHGDQRSGHPGLRPHFHRAAPLCGGGPCSQRPGHV